MFLSHSVKNQSNYKEDAITHNKLGLDSTLYLAYRDIPELLKKHLFDKVQKEKYRILDFGCGTGLSTELIAKMVMNAGYQIDIYGVDISEENIKFARQRLSQATFHVVGVSQPLEHLGQFDLIICNFVLVENTQDKMNIILKNIQSLLTDTGIAIITNCASKAYKISNKWYTFNNQFEENSPSEFNNKKIKFKEDQPIKVQVFASYGSDISFIFYDFFHSGSAYRNAYQTVGLDLLETHKPIGKKSDGIKWESEKKYSPYKIHILSKHKQPNKEMKNCQYRAKL